MFFSSFLFFFFFFNDTAPPEIYTLPLHDALPISSRSAARATPRRRSTGGSRRRRGRTSRPRASRRDRKSTRLNSSHGYISYAVFCLKKKKKKHRHRTHTCNNALYKIETVSMKYTS